MVQENIFPSQAARVSRLRFELSAHNGTAWQILGNTLGRGGQLAGKLTVEDPPRPRWPILLQSLKGNFDVELRSLHL